MSKIMEELFNELYAEEREEARTEAKLEAKLEAARNMLMKNKFLQEDIADCTGLSLETVQKLAEQLKAEPVLQ